MTLPSSIPLLIVTPLLNLYLFYASLIRPKKLGVLLPIRLSVYYFFLRVEIRGATLPQILKGMLL